MTREEQLACLEDRPCLVCKFHTNGCSRWTCVFEDEPEEQEPKYCDRNICIKNECNGIGCDECEVTKSQEPCEDCISRAEAQKHIYRRLWESALNNVGYECKAEDVFMDIADNRLNIWVSEIPSIQPKPKIGHWIISPNDCFVSCSECGLHGDKGIYKHYRWCPNCGARMVEPQERSDKE